MISARNGQRGEGFSFENVERNPKLAAQHGEKQLPQVMKTGTTLCGVVFKDGVVVAGDTRATAGPVVADTRCKKVHFLAPNILCCGAGTAADTENVTMMICSELTLARLETRKQSRVIEALTMLKRHLFQYQGHVSAALVLGGVDVDGPFLGTIAPHGSTDRLPFVAMGSGSLAAMGVLESGYKDNMTAEEAKGLCTAAICGGIFNDPFSGTQVDVAVITKDKVEQTYGHHQPNSAEEAKDPYTCSWSTKANFVPLEDRVPPIPPKTAPRTELIKLPPGTTPITKEEIKHLVTVTEVAVSSD